MTATPTIGRLTSMSQNPYQSPAESEQVDRSMAHAGVSWVLFGAICGALPLNVVAMLWSALSFLTPNRYVYVLTATLAGAVAGAVISATRISRLSANRVPKHYWWWLCGVILVWLLLIPAQ